MLDTVHNRVTASTLKGFSGKLTDNITGNQPVLWKLGQLGGIVTRGGGSSIAESIILEDNQSVHWYAGADPLDTTASDLTFAEVPWKQLAGIASITGIEKFKNSSQPERIFDLWDGLGKQLAMGFGQHFDLCAQAQQLGDIGRVDWLSMRLHHSLREPGR